MTEFYKFASESPVLTFFLVLIAANMVVGCVTALVGAFK